MFTLKSHIVSHTHFLLADIYIYIFFFLKRFNKTRDATSGLLIVLHFIIVYVYFANRYFMQKFETEKCIKYKYIYTYVDLELNCFRFYTPNGIIFNHID